MQSSEPILSVNLSVHSENTYACAAITTIEIYNISIIPPNSLSPIPVSFQFFPPWPLVSPTGNFSTL